MSLSGLSGNSGLSVTRVQPPAQDAGIPYSSAFQGNTLHNAISIKAKLTQNITVRVVYSTNADLRDCEYSTIFSSTNFISSITLTKLKPDTIYYWTIEKDGKRSSVIGKFKTFPQPLTATSFKFAAASCANTGSVRTAFQQIADLDISFFELIGDIHYRDISTNDVQLFRDAYEAILGLPQQAYFYRRLSVPYSYDDHDFGGDNSDGTSVVKPAVTQAFQEYIPHYPLPEGEGNNPIYFSFTCGRFLFIHTDNRYNKSVVTDVDGASKTVLGATQKQWLKDTMLAAKSTHRGIFWFNPFCWNGTNTASNEWSAYATERTEIADFIRTNDIPLVAIISGDAHMIAIDNGSSNAFDTNTVAPGCPIFQVAAIDRTGSTKGGTFSHGTPIEGSGQYGLFEITETPNYTRITGTCIDETTPLVPKFKHTFYCHSWEAFNDCYGGSTATTFTNKITNRQYQTTSPVFVPLKNYRTGATLTTEIRCSATGNVTIGTLETGGTDTMNVNTELREIFRNRMNNIYRENELLDVNARAIIDLRNLNPAKKYLLEMSTNRDTTTYLNQRGLRVTLNDALNVENLSTTGVTVHATNSIGFSSGYNRVAGHIVRWIFNPSVTGTVSINQQWDTTFASTTKAYPIKHFHLVELI